MGKEIVKDPETGESKLGVRINWKLPGRETKAKKDKVPRKRFNKQYHRTFRTNRIATPAIRLKIKRQKNKKFSKRGLELRKRF